MSQYLVVDASKLIWIVVKSRSQRILNFFFIHDCFRTNI